MWQTALQATIVFVFLLAVSASVYVAFLMRPHSKRTMPEAYEPNLQPRYAPASPYANAGAVPTPPQQPTARPLSIWWPQVVNKATHVMLAGETDSGKSTTAYALIAARATTDRIMIIDPHRKFNNWPVTPVNQKRDWQEIDRLFMAIERELDRRYDEDQDVGDPLTIVIDEYPAIAAECQHAATTFKRLVREGRKVSMRLILLTQSPLVKTLGIEGEGDVRENLWKVLLGGFAATVQGVVPNRPAALERYGKQEAVNLDGLLELSRTPVDPSAVWCPDLSGIAGYSSGWTEQHVKVAAWIMAEPGISTRELGRRLYPGSDGGGRYSVKAKELREQVEALLPDTVNVFYSHRTPWAETETA